MSEVLGRNELPALDWKHENNTVRPLVEIYKTAVEPRDAAVFPPQQ